MFKTSSYDNNNNNNVNSSPTLLVIHKYVIVKKLYQIQYNHPMT